MSLRTLLNIKPQKKQRKSRDITMFQSKHRYHINLSKILVPQVMQLVNSMIT